MLDPDKVKIAALLRRCRISAAPESAPARPDPLLLAAYAENRLDESAAAPVEAWLAAHPEAIDDVMAARDAGVDQASAPASATLISRAAALVPSRGAAVIPFRPRSTATWRRAVGWSGIAASVAAAGFLGFVLGTDTYLSFLGGPQELQMSVSQELFGLPAAALSDIADESST